MQDRPSPRRWLAASVLALLAAPALAADAAALDFEAVVAASGEVTWRAGGPPLLDAGEQRPGGGSSWNVDARNGTLRGSILFEGFWNASRARQVLPMIDGQYFTEFLGEAIDEARETAHFVNVSGTTARQEFLFSIMGGSDTTHRLTFAMDAAPPVFTLGEPRDLSHFGFLLTTGTDEPALADLFIRPAGGGGSVVFPTVTPARTQHFPVQGLDPETAYEYWISFWDFSRNRATTRVLDVTTTARPIVAPPVLLERFPEEGQELAAPPERILARVASPSASLAPGEVRLFVDAREVSGDVSFDGALATYVPPEPLAVGPHRVLLEVRDSAGGFLQAQWSFTVVGRSAALPEGLAVVALAASAVFLARRRA